MRTKYIFILNIALLILAGCGKNTPPDFDYGNIKEGVYRNAYFDFEATVPASWAVQSKDQMTSSMKEGEELLSGDDNKMKAVLKAADINVANLLAVYQYQAGAAVNYNPSFLIVAENVKNFPGIKTGADYLFNSRKLLQQSQFKYDQLDSVFSLERISGAEFYRMSAGIKYAGVDIKQIYYSTIMKGFSLNIIVSYADEKQKEALMNVIGSIRIKG